MGSVIFLSGTRMWRREQDFENIARYFFTADRFKIADNVTFAELIHLKRLNIMNGNLPFLAIHLHDDERRSFAIKRDPDKLGVMKTRNACHR